MGPWVKISNYTISNWILNSTNNSFTTLFYWCLYLRPIWIDGKWMNEWNLLPGSNLQCIKNRQVHSTWAHRRVWKSAGGSVNLGCKLCYLQFSWKTNKYKLDLRSVFFRFFVYTFFWIEETYAWLISFWYFCFFVFWSF